MKKRNLFIIIAVIIIFVGCFIGSKGILVENLEIPIGVGTDVDIDSSDTSYSVPFSVYTFQDDNSISSRILNGRASSLGKTRDTRQLQSDKKSMIGLNRIFVFSEASAYFGLKNHLDIWLNNPDINDRALCAVCKGRAEDMLKYTVKGYSSSAEYIEGQLKNLEQSNFFKTQYSLIDLIVRMDSEGRNSLIPYIEIKNNHLETTGLAVFKGDTMIAKADMEETKIINILKENNVNGILTLQKGPKQYINCSTYSKRKIKCYKKADQYTFVINLYLKGNIIANELYYNIDKNPQTLKKFQDDMKNHVEKLCNSLINNIKYKYKTDILDLGRVAAAKYGKGTGTDWNKVICDSDIKVNVYFKVDTEGRGDY